MTTFTDRPHRALLVVDMQVGVVTGAHEIDDVTSTIADLVDRARTADVPVVWVQDHGEGRDVGSDGWQVVAALDPRSDEPHVAKAYGDAFAETDLEDLLALLGVGEIVLTGAASEQCIRATLHSAVVRGYDVTLVQGAHTTTDLTEYGMPEPSVVRRFMDLTAAHGMEWPGRAGRSMRADDPGLLGG